jgi:hypothetical protein
MARVDIYRGDGLARFVLKVSPLNRHFGRALPSRRRPRAG